MLMVKKIVVQKRNVQLSGLRPLLLNPYPGNNKLKLPVAKRFYFAQDGKSLMIPVRNLSSMLSAQNTMSAAKLLGERKSKVLTFAFNSMVTFDPGDELPLMRNGKQIVFEGFGVNGIREFKYPGRLQGGVVGDTEPRPLIDTPWSLEFQLSFMDNEYFDEDFLQRAFVTSGALLGLGSYRGLYGKFEVVKWDEVADKKKK